MEGRGVAFKQNESAEMGMFILVLVKGGANYLVRRTLEGWEILVRGV